MNLSLLKTKIHRATVTDADLAYEGSISIDVELCRKAGLLPYEKVDVLDITNGNRLTTYVIPGGDGEICLNGAAARLVQPGDQVIIVAYCEIPSDEARQHVPKVVLVDEKNRFKELLELSMQAF